MAIESLTRKQLKKLHDEYISPLEKKAERKNSNIEKLQDELAEILKLTPEVIHIICLKKLSTYLNKSFEEMLNYNIIFTNKDNNDYKVIERSGNVVIKYHIENNHLFVNNEDIGEIDLFA